MSASNLDVERLRSVATLLRKSWPDIATVMEAVANDGDPEEIGAILSDGEEAYKALFIAWFMRRENYDAADWLALHPIAEMAFEPNVSRIEAP